MRGTNYLVYLFNLVIHAMQFSSQGDSSLCKTIWSAWKVFLIRSFSLDVYWVFKNRNCFQNQIICKNWLLHKHVVFKLWSGSGPSDLFEQALQLNLVQAKVLRTTNVNLHIKSQNVTRLWVSGRDNPFCPSQSKGWLFAQLFDSELTFKIKLCSHDKLHFFFKFKGMHLWLFCPFIWCINKPFFPYLFLIPYLPLHHCFL